MLAKGALRMGSAPLRGCPGLVGRFDRVWRAPTLPPVLLRWGGGRPWARMATGSAGAPARPSLMQRHPFALGTAIATVKTVLADVIVQMQVEGRGWGELDWRRIQVFGCFGFAYLGIGMYGLYVVGFGRLFPNMARFCNQPLAAKLKDGPGLRALVAQVGIDVLLVNPIIYFPTFYACKEMLAGGQPIDGLRKYATNWQPPTSRSS